MMSIKMMIAAFAALAMSVESFQPVSLCSLKNTCHQQKSQNFISTFHQSSIPQQKPTNIKLQMSTEPTKTNDAKPNNLPMLLDPGTKGGALFLSLVLFIVPIIIYEVVTLGFGIDGAEAGKWIGVGFTFFTTVLWVATYIFRVATKDMTYVSVERQSESEKFLGGHVSFITV